MATVDVTVMGGGIFGLSVAYACARRGAKVRLIEARAIGAGSSGGLVGALAPHVPENWNEKKAFQFDSLIMAEGFWAEVAGLSGLPTGYARSGRLQPLADAAQTELAQTRAETAAELWQGQASWRVVDRAEFAGWAPPSPTGLLIHDTLSARLHPRLAAASLVGALGKLGAEVVIGGAARPEGRVVWATGHEGLAEIRNPEGRPAGGGVKGQSLLLRHDVRDLPQLFVDGLHLVPHCDGTLAIGSTSEREFSDPGSTDVQCDTLLERAIVACPVLAAAPVLERWAGVRPRARSRAPILGPWPGRPGHFVANGGFKIGFGMAPAVGQAMADLVLDGQDRIPASFRVETCL